MAALTPEEQAARWVDAVWEERRGFFYFAFGHGGFFNAAGKYEFRRWDERPGEWPRDRDRFLEEALARSVGVDVYVAPYLRSIPSRKKGTALASSLIYADVDELDEGARGFERLLLGPGGLLVSSGAGLHAYVRLSDDLAPDELELWNRRLAAALHADAGWAENKVLRLPGTLNHKERAHGRASRPVTLLEFQAAPRDWTLAELDELLPSLANGNGSEPVRLERVLPARVAERVREKPGPDRSGQLFSFVGLCLEEGLSEGETIAAGLEHEPSRKKYGERLRGEIDRAIAKHGGARPRPELPPLRAVAIGDFAAVDEASAEPLLGDANDTVLSAGGALVFYGDGGAGKTTLEVDLVFHLAAGLPWLGLPVARPCRVLVVENEGPRGKFRVKLREKLAGWVGSPVDDRAHVLEEPWALFTFAAEEHRRGLRELIEELEVDVVAAGPVQRLGIEGGGTPEEVGAFVHNVELVRAELERPVAVVFAHHENKAGDVAGAWEGVPDTLAHVQARGNGATRLFWQKVRWGSTLHGKAWTLLWREGESFAIEDAPELADEDIAAAILAAVRENPGASWNVVDEKVQGRSTRRREVRDELLEAGELVNVGRGSRFVLYAPGDPLLERVRPVGDAPGTQLEFDTGSMGESAKCVPRPPDKGTQGRGRTSGGPGGREEDAA